MRYNKLVAGLILAGAVMAPAYADDHGKAPMTMQTKEGMREKGADMHQAGKGKGKEKGAAEKESADKASDDVMSGEESAEDAAEETGESGKKTADEARKVPPGMAKRDEHPSTGKGSEQGQESRAPEQKNWWRFWE